MRSSRWHAHGNVYLVTDDGPLVPDRVRAEVGDADGIVEVLDADRDRLEITIWNPDGSRAEMSGNGTRIAARWLSEQTGARVVAVHVGPRTVRATMLAEPLVEHVIEALRRRGAHVASGAFGAHMQVALVNDGPVTLILET